MIAFDTNVLVYSLDDAEPNKRDLAQQTLLDVTANSEHVVMLWQVACELVACLRRFAATGAIAESDIQQNLYSFLDAFDLVLPTRNVLDLAFRMHNQFSLSHWDSLLLAACVDAGVTTLYTEDLDAGATYETVSVVNPFT